MHTVFIFNQGIVTNISKYNLAQGFALKNYLCHKDNVCCRNPNENVKRYLIYSSSALNSLCICCTLIYLHKLKNAFVTGAVFNIELHSRKINILEH